MANFPALSLPRRSTAGLRTPAVLVVVWLLFGSAFVGLKFGVAAVPPFLFSGSRFLAAGAILLAWCAWRSGWRLELRPADVMAAGLVGLGLMGGGQGAASWAAQELSLPMFQTLEPDLARRVGELCLAAAPESVKRP